MMSIGTQQRESLFNRRHLDNNIQYSQGEILEPENDTRKVTDEGGINKSEMWQEHSARAFNPGRRL